MGDATIKGKIMPDDFKANVRTAGSVAVGGSATGEIEKKNDIDWFAVELVAGRTYVIDLEGSPTGGGTLANPLLRGLYGGGGVVLPPLAMTTAARAPMPG